MHGTPTITSLTPEGGPTAGGTSVVIKGKHFAPGSTVTFGSGTGTAVTFVTANQLTVQSPAHSAGTVRVTVTTAAGSTASTQADLYAYGSPTVTAVNPKTGPAAGGTTVTITGTSFLPDSTVKFGVKAATSVTFVSVTKLTAKAPAHAAGKVDVRVTTAVGTSATSTADAYTYTGAAAVAAQLRWRHGGVLRA